jgi:hypothetical protein
MFLATDVKRAVSQTTQRIGHLPYRRFLLYSDEALQKRANHLSAITLSFSVVQG